MVRALKDNPQVMAVSARQMANGETDLYSRWSLEMMYSSFGLNRDLKYAMRYPGLFDHLPSLTKRAMSFVDNVCACYRRSAIRRHGFAEIENAEDIDVGSRLIKAGHHLGFLYSTGVYHWHPMPPDYFLKRSFIGVKSMVEILGHPLPKLGSFHLASFEDVTRRCADLYKAARMSLDGIAGDELLTREDISRFLSRMNGAITDFTRACVPNSTGSPALEAMLVAIGARLDSRSGKSALKSNHLIIGFSQHLRSLVNYIMADGHSVCASKAGFADAIYKIAAAKAGELLGQWYMKLKNEDKQSEMESVRKILLRGICTS
jgi:hypothetical protein